ncbi:MAG: ABC transporter ATP-binding protein [Verrucomicrobia bacterium]|nr:ABC transporter ATP-binding protein [Verrucomicrobiota bacterium]
MARVVLDNVSKDYRAPGGATVRAVDRLALALAAEELLVLVGPSGSGKSTTLRLIAGLEEVTEGQISIDGAVVNDVEAKDRDIAMVFQHHALYPHLTVAENLGFALKLRKVPSARITTRVREAAAMLGLTAMLDRLPAALSGGERQRVAVGRALVRQPKLFLFDEPLSNLDPPMRAQLRIELAQLHQRLRATMLYVTHDQVEAMTLGDRIAVLHQGRIQQVADPLTLYQRPANLFVAGFIGSPPMNLFRGALARDNGTLQFRELGETQAPPGLVVRLPPALAGALAGFAGKPVVFGLRPEAIGERTVPAGGESVEARVQAAEPLGAETYLHLASAAHTFVARVPPRGRSEIPARMTLSFDMERAHFFDPGTGLAIV